MKTLSDLKRDCRNFKWSLVSNSFYKDIPSFQAEFRRVSIVKSTKFALETKRDEHTIDAWLDFPKASELTIKKIDCVGGNWAGCDHDYEITINRILKGNFSIPDSVHTMVYHLIPDFCTHKGLPV